MKKPYKTNDNTILRTAKNSANFCHTFNDFYFDNTLGYLKNDFTFIQKNQIKQRLQATDKIFTIAETGFGTGFNFLLTLQAYQEAQQVSSALLAPLHYISVEKYPLSKEQLIESLSIVPQLQSLALTLINCYPDNSSELYKNSLHASFFNDQVHLTVLFSDVEQALSTLDSKKKGVVDAWYLDGFDAIKNSDMWHKGVFTQIERLSKDQATLTSFTTDNVVKKHLKEIGFRLEAKCAENGHNDIPQNSNSNNNNLFAVMQSSPITTKGYHLKPRIEKPKHVSIIGGGIASACTAYALTKQGVNVTLYCKDYSLAQGGSSNAIAALFPLLHQQEDDMSVFYQQAFWRAKALYSEIEQQGFSFPHQWCGLLEVSYKDSLIKRQQAFDKIKAWPKELIHSVTAKHASNLASISLPYGGLFMPHAGWVSPQDLVKQIFNAAKATNRLTIITNTHITKIRQVANTVTDEITSEYPQAAAVEKNTSWCLSSNQGELNANVLVICAGADAIEIEQLKSLPLTATRGQVTSMNSIKKITKLSTVICHKGYLTPEHQGIHCIGATFQKNETSLETNKVDDLYNLTTLAKCLPELSAEVNWQEKDIVSSKARLRGMSQDHLPLVGAVPNIAQHLEAYPHLAKDKNWKYSKAAPCIDNLYVLLGLGARGFCSAPLAADILTAELCDTPYPMDNKMLFNLSPNRFIVRDIIKRKITI